MKSIKDKHISMKTLVGVWLVVLIAGFAFVWASVDDTVEQRVQDDPLGSVDTASLDFDPYALTEEDCTSFETFDPQTNECYYECETEEECASIEAKIEAELDSLFSDVDFSSFEEGERPADASGITFYSVSEGELVAKNTVAEQDQELWDLFLKVVPDYILFFDIVGYETYNDVNDGTAAYVYQDEADLTKWILGVNLDAMYVDGSLDRAEAVRTLIHEMAHVLTLRNSQVPASAVGGSCGTIQLQEGCAQADSYISVFNTRFWDSIRDSWPGEEASEDAIYDFFDANQDQFVSDYAATNLGEDIAESFMSFVIQPKSSGTEIKDQKINFFYEYPELVRLRDTIRQNIAL